MPYADLAEYLAARRALPEKEAFCDTLNALFAALEQGNTLITNNLSKDCMAFLQAHTLLSTGENADTPLVQQKNKIWLNRIFHSEKSLAADIKKRIKMPPYPLPDISQYTRNLTPEQQQAVMLALQEHLTIINGGPGTGKTYTVARIVQAILQAQPQTSVALAAPTGKAGKRMEESLKQHLPAALKAQLPAAQTLHRLLGIGNNSRRPAYHHKRPLQAELIIVDEASMLSLELACALFAAAAPDARLILLGDADQLAAVEAGAVLHDLSHHPALQKHLVTLKTTHRFSAQSGIGRLAADLHNKTLKNIRPYLEQQSDIRWYSKLPANFYSALFQPYLPYLAALQAPQPNPEECFAAFNHYRILAAGHFGALGCTAINQALTALHLSAIKQPFNSMAYHGMPVLITANNYTHRLFNGDIGICLLHEHEAWVYFPEHNTPVALSALTPLQRAPAYALTVHKAQGSEYEHIALCLDAGNEQLLSREMLYTGITRAKKQLDIFAGEQALQTAAHSPTQRHTGLAELL